MKGAGGTEGGVAQFFVGLAMAVGGAYLLTQRVTVTSGFWSFFGGHTFGLSLLPLVVGAGMLFYDGKSRLGWILTAGGALIVFLGILMNLRDLLRAHEPLRHAGHARAAGGRDRPHRPIAQAAGDGERSRQTRVPRPTERPIRPVAPWPGS